MLMPRVILQTRICNYYEKIAVFRKIKQKKVCNLYCLGHKYGN